MNFLLGSIDVLLAIGAAMAMSILAGVTVYFGFLGVSALFSVVFEAGLRVVGWRPRTALGARRPAASPSSA